MAVSEELKALGRWTVTLSRSVEKAKDSLPKNMKASLVAFIKDIEVSRPIRGNWQNYSKLGRNRHHCHLKKGKPTYVAVWEVVNKEVRIVEVIYAGTHEKAPY